MLILNEIWNQDGRYAKVDGILRCWRKAEILPINMQTFIENKVGRNIPTKMKVISDDDCKVLCKLMNQLQVKAQSTGVLINSDAIALQNSIAGEQQLTEEERVSIVQNWANIEDQPLMRNAHVEDEIETIPAEMMGGIEQLALGDDDEEPEVELLSASVLNDDEKLSKAQIEDMVELLKKNCGEYGGDKAFDYLDKFICVVRNAQHQKPKEQRTLHSYFPARKPSADVVDL
jgi:hypothetical protein